MLIPAVVLVFCLAVPALAAEVYSGRFVNGVAELTVSPGTYAIFIRDVDEVEVEVGTITWSAGDDYCTDVGSGLASLNICISDNYLEVEYTGGAPEFFSGVVCFQPISPSVDDGVPIVSAITGIWGAFASWIVARLADMQAVFWVATKTGGRLTFMGVLAVAALGIGFVFLLIGVVQRFIKLRS